MRYDQKKNNSIYLITSPIINEKFVIANHSSDIWLLRLQLFHLGLNFTFHYGFP
jgi:hypothetical protein